MSEMKQIGSEVSQVCSVHSVSPLRDVVINFNINIHEIQVELKNRMQIKNPWKH